MLSDLFQRYSLWLPIACLLLSSACHNATRGADKEASVSPKSIPGTSKIAVERNDDTSSRTLADYKNSRVRCNYTSKTKGQYQADCAVVAYQVDGTEFYAIRPRQGLVLNWQEPKTVAGQATTSNCAAASNAMTYRCDVAVSDTSTAAQVQFGLSIAETGHAARVETSSLLLPYSVGITLGLVPGLPVSYLGVKSTTAAAALDDAAPIKAGFQQFDFAANATDFGKSGGLCARGSRLFFSHGVFVYELNNGRINLYGGSGNPIDQNNLTDRRNVFLNPYSIACTPDAVYVLSRALRRIHKLSDSGTVELLVGDGNDGAAPDGAVAKGAPIHYPDGLAVDSSGQVYFGDGGCALRTILADGTLKTVAGACTDGHLADNGPALQANFAFISALVAAPDGSIYAADSNSGTVRKITKNGMITTIAGTGVQRYDDKSGATNTLAEPFGLALDPQGNLYIGEFYRGIKKVTPSGAISQLVVAGDDIPYSYVDATQGEWDFVPMAPADLAIYNSRPIFTGFFVAADGTLYVNGLHGIIKLAPNGQAFTSVSGPAANAPKADCQAAMPGALSHLIEASALTYTSDNHLMVLDWLSRDSNQMVLKNAYDAGGSAMVQTVAGCGQEAWLAGNNQLTFRAGFMVLGNAGAVATAADGSTFVANRMQGKIYRYARNGSVSLYAGTGAGVSSGDNGPALQASLLNPSGLALGADGSLYLVEYSSDLLLNKQAGSRIRRIDPAGTITTVAGTGLVGDSGEGQAAINARFSASSIAVTATGRLFIADLGNNKIKVVEPNGLIHTIAGRGTGTQVLSTGPVDALQTDLWGPLSIAVANDGQVYFTNFGSAQVKQLKPRVGGGYDLYNFFGKTTQDRCSTTNDNGSATEANVNRQIQNSMAILCEGQPRAITIKDTCPAAGGSTRIAFSQLFDRYVNVVEIVRPCRNN